MTENLEKNATIFKALSDLNRLKIFKMLSNNEMCGCKLLEHFNITQPTLSHHMKVLCDCGLVIATKKGIWMHYKLNINEVNDMLSFFKAIGNENENLNDCGCE